MAVSSDWIVCSLIVGASESLRSTHGKSEKSADSHFQISVKVKFQMEFSARLLNSFSMSATKALFILTMPNILTSLTFKNSVHKCTHHNLVTTI